ncbi:acetyltransferase [Bombiscardovia nodaiensis]|uniref:Acetyltransferase n=1 Tax=Bombiscardovia nodaiensis TaxID=2932181 RepID=A0ABM8B5M5_9BIFI|nr:acetyltransferase [Bombiscardovia nodaiensis]
MKLVAYDSQFKESLDQYQIENLTFTGTPAQALARAQNDGEYHPILSINSAGAITNFFVLDHGSDRLRYEHREDCLLLRSFSTDSRYLRQGYALQSLQLLSDYAHRNFPDIPLVVLGVNARNSPAQKLYEKAGFTRLERTFTGGKGPQFIYRLAV